MSDSQHAVNTENPNNDALDIKILLYRALRLWYIFLIAIIVSMFIATLFNKYARPIYEVTSTVLIQDSKKGGLGDLSSIMGFSYGNSQQNLQNEIGLLYSEALVGKALDKINWEISYYNRGDFVNEEMYKSSPFKVTTDTSHIQPVNLKFNIVILDQKKYRIETEGENAKLYSYGRNDFIYMDGETVTVERINLKGEYSFGEWIENEHMRFYLELNSGITTEKYINKPLYFIMNDLESQINEYNNYSVEPINREASILQLKLKGSNAKKSADLLNALVNTYISFGLERKNQIATKTIEFIDRELVGIRDSLTIAETQLENFRKTNQIIKIDYEAQQVFSYLNDLDKEMAELRVKAKYYNYLRDYLNQKNDVEDLIAPASMGIEDPMLNALLSELNKLYSEKAGAMVSSTAKNPIIGQIETQIRNTKANLLENINNIINASDIAMQDIKSRISLLSKKITALPENQRKLLSFEREFNLNNNLFTFLLQRRAEAQITKASNMPDNQVVDIAKSNHPLPIYPKKGLNLMIGFLFGVLVPSLYIYLSEKLTHRVSTRNDIDRHAKYPSIGYILHAPSGTKLIAYKSPKSVIAESFRTLRTNLMLLAPENRKQVILVTSDLVGAGKTFISINLAITYAQFGKKTLLIGFDLRKPKIFQDFGLSNTEGVSSYLIGKNQFSEVIFESGIENLYIAPAGPIPPNPLVLIYSERTDEFFRNAADEFDYIIIDTPPVGLMTDAILLMKYADYGLYVVRQGITNKNALRQITSDMERQGIKNMFTIMNDVKYSEGGYTYGYGYSYSMGYGYGYDMGFYDDEDDPDTYYEETAGHTTGNGLHDNIRKQ